MKPGFFLFLAFFLASAINATAQNRAQNQQPNNELVNVTDFTSESEPFNGEIYIVNNNYYVAGSAESVLANLKVERKDVVAYINMASNPHPSNQAIIEYEKKRLPEKYRNFVAIVTYRPK